MSCSLHDVSRHSVLAPLIINLPAFPVQDTADVQSYLPRFLQRYPSATIHYRWPERGRTISDHESTSAPGDDEQHGSNRPLHWPTPIHDTLAAFDFLTRTLTPPPSTGTYEDFRPQRRDVYVYGSYLGASLAASLSLTESHAHKPMAVRGLLALNGIYNWTTFLPDHSVNTTRLKMQRDLGLDLSVLEQRDHSGQDLGMLKALLPRLFRQPDNLFDPFASPVLFFHSPGMMVPPSFTERWRPKYPSQQSPTSSSGGAIDPYDYVYSDPEDPPPPTPFPEAETHAGSGAETDSDPDPATIPPPPRKGYFAFPPRASTLRIPEALLLHSTPPPLPDIPASIEGFTRRTAAWKKLKNAENSFASQALGLASLMRRSLKKLKLKESKQWDEDPGDPEAEAARWVETGDIRWDGSGQGAEPEDRARQWLEERLG